MRKKGGNGDPESRSIYAAQNEDEGRALLRAESAREEWALALLNIDV